MPNIKSAKKRVKVTEIKTLNNRTFKTALKTSVKKFLAAVESGDKAAASACYTEAVKMMDKAVAKNLVHKNNAAHKKSALTVKLNSIG